jgi:hypothetical protein
MNYKEEFQRLEAATNKAYEENNKEYFQATVSAYDNARDTEIEGGFDHCETEEEKQEEFWYIAYASICSTAQFVEDEETRNWFKELGYIG